MELLELGYKTFTYVSSRNIPNNQYAKYIWENKQQVLSIFGDVYKVQEVLQFGLKNINQFSVIAIKDTHNKEIVLAINKQKANPALNLFELLVNGRYLSESELKLCKNTYFKNKDNTLVFYKKIDTIEGAAIYQTMVDAFNFHKANNNQEAKDKSASFQFLSSHINLIMCRRCVDILDNVHFETIINPNISANENLKKDIKQHLNNIDALFNF